MAGRNTSETRQSDWIMPPMAFAGGANPAVCALAASTAQVTVDLTSMWGTAANVNLNISNEDYNPNPIGHYLSLQADGGDIYIAFSGTVANLTGGNAIDPNAVSTVSGNAIAAVRGGCLKIPNGYIAQFKLPGSNFGPPATYDNADRGITSLARYLAFRTAAGTATLRMFQSSP